MKTLLSVVLVLFCFLQQSHGNDHYSYQSPPPPALPPPPPCSPPPSYSTPSSPKTPSTPPTTPPLSPPPLPNSPPVPPPSTPPTPTTPPSSSTPPPGHGSPTSPPPAGGSPPGSTGTPPSGPSTSSPPPQPPPSPPSGPGNHRTVYIAVFVPVGLFCAAALAGCLFFAFKKKQKPLYGEAEVVEHVGVTQTVVTEPCGEQVVTTTVDEEIGIHEEIRT